MRFCTDKNDADHVAELKQNKKHIVRKPAMRLHKVQTRWNSCCFYCHLASIQVPLLSLNSRCDHHCYECTASAEMDIHAGVSPSKTSICAFFYVALLSRRLIQNRRMSAHHTQNPTMWFQVSFGCSSLCYLHQIFSPGLSEAYKFQSWAKKEVNGESDMSAVHTERLGTGNIHLPPTRHSHTSHHCADQGVFFPFFAPPSYSSPHLPRGTNEATDSAPWHAAKNFLASFSSICSPLL